MTSTVGSGWFKRQPTTMHNRKYLYALSSNKKAEYEANGISKQNGNLFTTEDDEEGGLNPKQIEAVINQIKKTN